MHVSDLNSILQLGGTAGLACQAKRTAATRKFRRIAKEQDTCAMTMDGAMQASSLKKLDMMRMPAYTRWYS